MNKYCRYCSYCSYRDTPYCSIKEKTMSEETIKHINNCKSFDFNEIDVITNNCYKPRIKKQNINQLKMEI